MLANIAKAGIIAQTASLEVGLNIISDLMETFPQHYALLVSKAITLLIEAKDFNNARVLLTKDTPLATPSEYYYLEALLFFHQKKYQQSIAKLKSLDSRKHQLKTMRLLARALLANNQEQQAKLVIEQALTIWPEQQSLQADYQELTAQ